MQNSAEDSHLNMLSLGAWNCNDLPVCWNACLFWLYLHVFCRWNVRYMTLYSFILILNLISFVSLNDAMDMQTSCHNQHM